MVACGGRIVNLHELMARKSPRGDKNPARATVAAQKPVHPDSATSAGKASRTAPPTHAAPAEHPSRSARRPEQPVKPSAEMPEIAADDAVQSVALDDGLYDNRPQEMYKLAAQLGIDIPVSKDLCLRKAAACLGTVFRVIGNDSSNKNMLWPMTKSIAGDIECMIGTDANLVTELQRPRVDRDRLIWHSLYTAILAMELAQDTPDLTCSIQEIGAAALLHDIGKLVLPEFFSSVNQENSPVYQEHVNRGVELAQEIAAPESVVAIIAQHHEQLDGQGFPNHISGDEMLLDSQIVAVSNLFEKAQISLLVPTGEIATPVPIDIPMLFKQCRNAFDNNLLKKMIRIIGFYPAGSIVELNNRSICAVIRQNADFPLRPMLKVIMDGSGSHPEQEQIIDLRQTAVLSITKSIKRARADM